VIGYLAIWTLAMKKYFAGYHAGEQPDGGLLIGTFLNLFYLPVLYIRMMGNIRPGPGVWAC